MPLTAVRSGPLYWQRECAPKPYYG